MLPYFWRHANAARKMQHLEFLSLSYLALCIPCLSCLSCLLHLVKYYLSCCYLFCLHMHAFLHSWLIQWWMLPPNFMTTRSLVLQFYGGHLLQQKIVVKFFIWSTNWNWVSSKLIFYKILQNLSISQVNFSIFFFAGFC